METCKMSKTHNETVLFKTKIHTHCIRWLMRWMIGLMKKCICPADFGSCALLYYSVGEWQGEMEPLPEAYLPLNVTKSTIPSLWGRVSEAGCLNVGHDKKEKVRYLSSKRWHCLNSPNHQLKGKVSEKEIHCNWVKLLLLLPMCIWMNSHKHTHSSDWFRYSITHSLNVHPI